MKSPLAKGANLWQRVATAVVGGGLLVLCIVWHAYAYAVLFLAIQIVAQWEFYRLLKLNQDSPLPAFGCLMGALLNVACWLQAQGGLHSRWFLALFPLFSLAYFFKLYDRKEVKPFANLGLHYLGIAYVALPFSLFHYAAYSLGSYSWQVVLGCLLLLWASDTGAYFAGSSMGRTRLFERVSPKKSWEGSLGGLLLSMGTAAALGIYFSALPAFSWFALSAIIVVVGTYGDLVESLFKRSIAIKDSGSLLPGHGGLLDRFDGLLLASPFIAAYLNLTLS